MSIVLVIFMMTNMYIDKHIANMYLYKLFKMVFQIFLH